MTGAGKLAAAGPMQRRAQGLGTQHTALPQANAKNRVVTGCSGGLGSGAGPGAATRARARAGPVS